MKRLFIVFLLTICCMTSVYGISDFLYKEMGYINANTNEMPLLADYNTLGFFPFIELSFGTDDIVMGVHSSAVVGQLDGDSSPEIVYNDGEFIWVTHYNQDTQEFVLEDMIATYDVYSPITLYDGDSDGYDEIYFCGIEDVEGDSTFYALELVDGDITEKWQVEIGDNNVNPTSLSEMGCGLGNTGTTADAHTTQYKPICTSSGGTKYCMYIGVRDNGGNGRRNTRPFFYRFNAETGAETQFNPITTNIESDDDCRWTGSSTEVYGIGATGINLKKINEDEEIIIPVVCDLDGDGSQNLIIPLACQNPSATNFHYLFYNLEITTFTPDTDFDNNGAVTILNIADDYTISSPSCYDRGDGFKLYFARENGADIYDLERIDDDGTVSTEISAIAQGSEVSNLFFGEFNGDANVDACFITNDNVNTEFDFACSNIAGFVADTVTFTIDYNGTRDLRSSVVSTGKGFLGSNLAGDSNSDVWFNFGLFEGNADAETFTEAINSPGYIDAQMTWTDLNRDGFTDAIYKKNTQIEFGIYNGTDINENVDFKQVIPDVAGAPMCSGNQSFLIKNAPIGYEDLEENNIKIKIDCNNNGTYEVNTAFFGYGGSFDSEDGLICTYSEGQYTAKIVMTDNIHASLENEVIFVETVVSDIQGCESPCHPNCDTSDYDDGDAIIDVDEPDADETDADGLPEITEQLSAVTSVLGIKTARSKAFFTGLVIIAVMWAFVSMGGRGWILGLISSLIIMIMATQEGFLPGIYLIGTLILLVFLIIFLPMFMNRGNGN